MSRILDAALLRLGDGYEYGGGLSNHGPMAAEALLALGREDAIPGFAEAYAVRLDAPPIPLRAVGDDWHAALGDESRVRGWEERFAAELDDGPWEGVLERWAPRLAPGMIGAAAHGWLRAAHAVRALARSDTEVRRRELARGLAYWAASFTPLPGTLAPEGGPGIEDAARRLPRVPARGPEALLTDGIPRLFESPAFAQAVGRVDLGGEPLAHVGAASRAAARFFLANSHRGALFAAIHAVTAASALRLVIPHVSSPTAGLLLWHGWQAVAGLQSAFGATMEAPAFVPYVGSAGALVDRAIACADEHGIKFTEACLREHALDPEPVYLAAADDLLGCFEALARARAGAA